MLSMFCYLCITMLCYLFMLIRTLSLPSPYVMYMYKIIILMSTVNIKLFAWKFRSSGYLAAHMCVSSFVLALHKWLILSIVLWMTARVIDIK